MGPRGAHGGAPWGAQGHGAPWGGSMGGPGAWASRTWGPGAWASRTQGGMGLKDPGLKDLGPRRGQGSILILCEY